MEQAIVDLGGKILALCRVTFGRHQSAIEYELLKLGRNIEDLGTPALSWRDLEVIIANTPVDSALGRSMVGERAEWGISDYLSALVVDALNAGNWQRGGGKGSRPKPLPRPGKKSGGRQMGSEPIPASTFDGWWDAPREDPDAESEPDLAVDPVGESETVELTEERRRWRLSNTTTE